MNYLRVLLLPFLGRFFILWHFIFFSIDSIRHLANELRVVFDGSKLESQRPALVNFVFARSLKLLHQHECVLHVLLVFL